MFLLNYLFLTLQPCCSVAVLQAGKPRASAPSQQQILTNRKRYPKGIGDCKPHNFSSIQNLLFPERYAFYSFYGYHFRIFQKKVRSSTSEKRIPPKVMEIVRVSDQDTFSALFVAERLHDRVLAGLRVLSTACNLANLRC